MDSFDFSTDPSLSDLSMFYPAQGQASGLDADGKLSLGGSVAMPSELSGNSHADGTSKEEAHYTVHHSIPASEGATQFHHGHSVRPSEGAYAQPALRGDTVNMQYYPGMFQGGLTQFQQAGAPHPTSNGHVQDMNAGHSFSGDMGTPIRIQGLDMEMQKETSGFSQMNALGNVSPFVRPQPNTKSYPGMEFSITPSSVFSTVSSASTNDFLSPITSPMLQPQGAHHQKPGMFRMNENDSSGQLSQQMMQLQSPHVAQNVSHAGAMHRPQDEKMSSEYAMSMRAAGPRSLASSPSVAEHPTVRRSRTAEGKIHRVRPSPLMKPTSPKRRGSQGPWPSMKGEASPVPSPSLNALESLSSTMQEASNLSMPAAAAHAGQAQQNFNGTPVQQSSDGRSYGGQQAQQVASDSPSPIDMTTNGSGHPSPRAMAAPVTPGTLMGLIYPPQPGSEPSSVRPNDPNISPHHSDTTSGNGMPNGYNYNGSTHPLSSMAAGPQNIITNVPNRPSAVFPAGSQHKPILPGNLSSENRAAWMNMRRMGQGGLDQRRTSHKAAEQKRRDSLKHCFDELRGLLPAITIDESVPGGSLLGPDGTKEDRFADGFEVNSGSPEDNAETQDPVVTEERARDANRAIAKVLLLRHSNEYLLRLKRRIERRDMAVQSLSAEVMRLRSLLAEQDSKAMPDTSAQVASKNASADTTGGGKLSEPLATKADGAV